MKITSILDIIDGKLLNHPSISFIYSIKTNPKKVREGDLFIVKNNADIPLALQNGAFAFIIEEDINIIDNEVAWINVLSVENSIKRLIRFLLSNKKLTAFYCNDISYELFKILKKPTVQTNIKIVPKDLSSFFKTIDGINDNDTLICSCPKVLDTIYPVNFNFNTKNYEVKNLIEHSIFETSFSYNERYFSKIKISSLYLSEFLGVYSFLDFNVNLNKLKHFINLKPIFVDKLINHTEHGKTDKFLIAQKNNKLVPKEIKYLKSKYKYGKILYLTTKENNHYEGIKYKSIDSFNNLKDFLKKLHFNAVYLLDTSYNELYEQISKQKNKPSLL